MRHFFRRLTQKNTVDEQAEARLGVILSRATAGLVSFLNSPSAARLPELIRAIELFEAVVRASNPQTTPEAFARAHVNLGAAYVNLPVGHRGENLETAIRHFEAASEVYTFANSPEDWAMVQNNLGNAFVQVPTGDISENLRHAIACFQSALRVRTERDLPLDWAKTQNNLGLAYQALPAGDRQENLERAIGYHLAALRVYTEEDFRVNWAWTQTNLLNAYRRLPRGDHKENLRQAFACFQSAQRVFSERDFPADWASSQNNLGTAYLELGSDDIVDLSKAIDCFDAALRVFTEDNFSVEWAATRNNLAEALVSRGKLSKGDGDFHRAIECCEAALRTSTKDADPQQWAALHTTLSNVYYHLETGGRTSNLQRSLEHCELSLQVFTEQSFPREWATCQNNLGIAYVELTTGDIRWNVERALECYRAALRVFNETDFPEPWAMTQNNMGSAYGDLPTERTRRALANAIVCYKSALRVYTETDYPNSWAMVNGNLGNTYSEGPTEDRDSDLLRARECYEAALRFYSKSNSPLDWARIQNCLGALFSDSGRTSGEELQKAIACYENALTVYTEQENPWSWASACNNLAIALHHLPSGDRRSNLDRAVGLYDAALRTYATAGAESHKKDALNNLGALFFGEQDWRRALSAYSEAITLLEQIRVSYLDDTGRKRVLSEAWRVFERAALCAIRLEDYTGALLLIERGKTRNIADHLWRKDVAPKGVSGEDWRIYQEHLSQARASETLLNSRATFVVGNRDAGGGENRKLNLLNDMVALRQRIGALEKRFAVSDPDYVPMARALDMDRIADLATRSCAVIVDFRVSSEGTYVLTVGPGERQVTEDQVIGIPSLTTRELNAQVLQWLAKQNDAGWPDYVESFLGRVYQILLEPVHQRLLRRYSKVKRLILVTSQGLTLLPLHAAWWLDKDRERKCLLDDYEIAYVPSCQVLERCLTREEKFGGPAQSLFAVQNPTGNLPFADWEVEDIRRHFLPENSTILEGDRADPAAVARGIGLGEEKVFSTHGWFDAGDVEKSHLALYGGQLTIPQIVASGLDRSWLVVLSACLTGLTDAKDIMDEYQSMPAAFLVAGAHTVIASLWSVSDISTALLMQRFHANLYEEKAAKAAALREAQIWLRDLPYAEVVALLETRSPAGLPSYGLLKRRLGEAAERHGGRPFANPHWWAAFQCVGAGWTPN